MKRSELKQIIKSVIEENKNVFEESGELEKQNVNMAIIRWMKVLGKDITKNKNTYFITPFLQDLEKEILSIDKE